MYNDEARLPWRNLGIFFIKIGIFLRGEHSAVRIFAKTNQKHMRQFTLLLTIALITLSGCLGNKEPDTERLYTDVESVTATAEFLPGSDENEKIVIVSSNRSWYAHLNDVDHPVAIDQEVQWASIDVREHLNLTKVLEEVPIAIRFNRNTSQAAINGKLDFYSEGEIFLSVPIVQEGAVYHLQAVPDKTDANCDQDVIHISVDCNTEWSAQIVSATANVSLDKASGFDPGILSVSFEENYEVTEKYAQIKISASDCEDILINLTQDESVPYLKLSPSNVYQLPGDAVSGKIIIQTNCAWTAEVASATLSDVVLSKTQGDAGISGDQEIEFSFTNPGGDPKTLLNAIFTIKTDYAELNPEYTQRCPLILDFINGSWSPALPTSASADEKYYAVTAGESQYTISLCVFYMKSTYMLIRGYLNPTYGFLKTPAIDNLTLKTIELVKKKNSSYYKVTAKVEDLNGVKVANLVSDSTIDDVKVKWTLGDTGVEPQPGKSYKLLCTQNQNCAASKIILYYE